MAVVPERLQGRVTSVFRIVGQGMGPFGLAMTGVLLDRVGGAATALACGSLMGPASPGDHGQPARLECPSACVRRSVTPGDLLGSRRGGETSCLTALTGLTPQLLRTT
jgi:hypothetical protein